ncbi:MAG TPA: YlxM family DNA-binding protein [Firmicutes bacterium]|nr:YlxM family DNA-binding protein [Bacillota bacterium]
MIEKTLRMALLFDTYGSVLTEKQREIFSLYYNDDLSLGEIADNYQVSRQAVKDTLRRSETTLNALEERLGLVERKERQRVMAVEMLSALQVVESALAQATPEIRSQVKNALATLQAGLQNVAEQDEDA